MKNLPKYKLDLETSVSDTITRFFGNGFPVYHNNKNSKDIILYGNGIYHPGYICTPDEYDTGDGENSYPYMIILQETING